MSECASAECASAERASAERASANLQPDPIGDFAGSSCGGGQHLIRCTARRSDVDCSIGDGLSSSEDEDLEVWLSPSGVVAPVKLDPELTAMLARAAVSQQPTPGLEVNSLPIPEPSWLDDWFIGASHGSQPSSTQCLSSEGA